MALAYQSLLLYGFEITTTNQYISFQNASSGPVLVATIDVGFYTLTSLMAAIAAAMTSIDGTNTYGYSIDRTLSNGTENRVTISTQGTFLSLLFSSGNPSNPASLLGFNATDYTGATSYNSSSSAGTAIVPDYLGYNYKDANQIRKNFGSVNISASGLKESIVFALQQFTQVQFKHELKANLGTARWQPFVDWMIQQCPFEFTPEIGSPNTYYQVTLEDPNNGLEFEWMEELPDMPNYYSTPVMKYRLIPQ